MFKKKLCLDKKCVFCFNNSFAGFDKDKVSCWSDKNDKKPWEVTLFTNKKYWFDCNKCNHSFCTRIYHITKDGNWCPYCNHRRICGDKNCEFCFKNSFASIYKEEIACWSRKNEQFVYEIFKYSNKKYWFDCKKCGHSFHNSPNNITKQKIRCCFCSKKKLCNNKNCVLCFNNSFASFDREKVACWNKKNTKTPREIFKSTNKKYWFDCKECGHSFYSSLNSITGKNHCWCPLCKFKTEKQFLQWLKDNYKYKINYQIRYKWSKSSKTNRYLPFDFAIEKIKLIIEIDGRHHFEQISNWNPPEENLRRDKYKMQKALTNGYSIIRIFQEDIYHNKNNWENKARETIRLYNKPTIICIGCEKMYEHHKII
ncbi:MAG: hypothetical protein CMB80_24655 [Flammeovirgaceae bacterium]|nr:hypothetical protein [Flammeovirgaceae bacterium]